MVQKVVGTGATEGAPVVTVIGGGQLARMMAEAASAMGVRLRAVVEAADGSAGQVVPDSIVGDADDADLLRATAEGVVTVEHEHVPGEILDELDARPGADALVYAQDKLAMRSKMDELGIPQPRWARCVGEADIQAAIAHLGGRAVAKTPRGGYDGKGVAVVESAADIPWGTDDPLLIEEFLDFDVEVAALVARSPSGEVRSWPVAQTVQQNGVCFEVCAPAPIDDAIAVAIAGMGERIAEAVGVVGVLAVEMFMVDGEAFVNELAMRPHNSGHWTIEGAVTSQFEQHVRAVLDWPLGETRAREPYSVMVNVLGSALDDPRDGLPDMYRRFPHAKAHIYGKQVRPGRKLGHVTVTGDDLEACRHDAHGAAAMLRGERG